jgi:phosphatidylinositol alpha-1,6-mannosyltransferase
MLSVSRLADGKGFPHLVRMMPDIIKKAPHVVWMIVGDGPKKELILEEIQKRNLQNVVRFVGQVPHEAMRVYYYLADLFVLLTHPDEGKEEGLGLVFLEAAAAGLPVIAGRSGGVEEAVLDGKTGMVFDLQAQAREIPAAIGDLLKDTAREKELGENAQARIRSNFQWEYQIDKLRPWLME